MSPEMAPKSVRITCRKPGAVRQVMLGGHPTGEVWPMGVRRIAPSATWPLLRERGSSLTGTYRQDERSS